MTVEQKDEEVEEFQVLQLWTQVAEVIELHLVFSVKPNII